MGACAYANAATPNIAVRARCAIARRGPLTKRSSGGNPPWRRLPRGAKRWPRAWRKRPPGSAAVRIIMPARRPKLPAPRVSCANGLRTNIASRSPGRRPPSTAYRSSGWHAPAISVLVAERLQKSYGMRTLFRDLSFHLRRGGRLVIRGANGSGKTTLLNITGGALQPDAGSVRFGASVEPATSVGFGHARCAPIARRDLRRGFRRAHRSGVGSHPQQPR